MKATYRKVGATVTRTYHEIASHQVRGGQGAGVPRKPPRGVDNPAFLKVQGPLNASQKHLLAQLERGRGRGG